MMSAGCSRTVIATGWTSRARSKPFRKFCLSGLAIARGPNCTTLCRVQTFEELARTSDEAIDIAFGAALVAKDVYEKLDPNTVVDQLDVLAAPLTRLDLPCVTPQKQAEAVSERFRD